MRTRLRGERSPSWTRYYSTGTTSRCWCPEESILRLYSKSLLWMDDRWSLLALFPGHYPPPPPPPKALLFLFAMMFTSSENNVIARSTSLLSVTIVLDSFLVVQRSRAFISDTHRTHHSPLFTALCLVYYFMMVCSYQSEGLTTSIVNNIQLCMLFAANGVENNCMFYPRLTC